MAVKKEPVAPAPVVSDKKKALETAMAQIEKAPQHPAEQITHIFTWYHTIR